MNLTSTEAVFCVSFSRFQSDYREISQKWSRQHWILSRSSVHLANFCTRGDRYRAASCRQQPVFRNIGFTPSSKQPRCWRGPGFRQQVCSGWSHFFIQVSEYLPDHLRVFNTSNDPGITTTFTTGFNIDIEHSLQPLCPGH